jgi:AcrR family transcriptional regulator
MRVLSFIKKEEIGTPKVDKDYIIKKKTEILDAALLIFQKKPLYEMTMLDIIKEAGLSKGGIYRYFSDIDEVIIALINRETVKNKYIHKIDEILVNNSNKADIIEALFSFLGSYIDNSPVTLGKFQFELTVY